LTTIETARRFVYDIRVGTVQNFANFAI